MLIRPYVPQDVFQICDIYNDYIQHTVITFEEQTLSYQQMSERIDSSIKSYPWLVCEIENKVVGYAYASKWKERSAYRHTAEVTIYLQQGTTRNGYGKALYSELLKQLETLNCHTILACIALPNEASEKIHDHFGFEKVAHFKEVGRKFEKWIDVGYWQKLVGQNL